MGEQIVTVPEPHGGDIETYAMDLLDIANKTSRETHGSFNGIEVVAVPGGQVSGVIKGWGDIRRDREAGRIERRNRREERRTKSVRVCQRLASWYQAHGSITGNGVLRQLCMDALQLYPNGTEDAKDV